MIHSLNLILTSAASEDSMTFGQIESLVSSVFRIDLEIVIQTRLLGFCLSRRGKCVYPKQRDYIYIYIYICPHSGELRERQ